MKKREIQKVIDMNILALLIFVILSILLFACGYGIGARSTSIEMISVILILILTIAAGFEFKPAQLSQKLTIFAMLYAFVVMLIGMIVGGGRSDRKRHMED